MGLLDRLLGRTPADDTRAPAPPPAPQQGDRQPAHRGAPAARTDDERALERYRYLLRTAPPETVEQAHEEAFAKLTPEQRRQVLTQLSAELPEAERARDDDPRSLARAATRAEVRQPGTLERAFGGRGGAVGGGVGLGGIVAGSLMGSIAGAFIGTAIADSLLDGDGAGDDSADGGQDDGQDVGQDDAQDGAQDGGGQDDGDGGGYQDDLSAAGDTGGDYGGDLGGGDFGGGDFGGGDFGGGDF